MKGFSGFKESPVKAKKKTIGPDTGLLEAADNMDRGLTNPTSLVGMGVLGFLDGYNASTKAINEGDSDAEKQAKKDDKVKKLEFKRKKVELRRLQRKKDKKDKQNPKGSTTGTLSPEEQEIFREQNDPISNIDKSDANINKKKKKKKKIKKIAKKIVKAVVL